MSDAWVTGLLILAGTILSLGGSIGITVWLNRKKVSLEPQQIQADTTLKSGEVTAHYLDMFERVSKKYDDSETEKVELRKQVEKLQNDVDDIREQTQKEIDDLKKQMKKDHDELMTLLEDEKDYSGRLELQLSSWRISPVPRNIDAAKLALKENLCIDGSDLAEKK
jgi:predicted nuclease with TOPRIM domain